MATTAGGPPEVCAGLARSLAARGHTVTIATLMDSTAPMTAVDPAVRLHASPPDDPTPRGRRYGASEAFEHWLRDHIREFDIVHIHSIWQFPTFAAARACRRQGIPYVVLLNNMLNRYAVRQGASFVKRLYWFWRERTIEREAKALHFLNRAEIRNSVSWVRDLPKFVIGNGIAEAQIASLPAPGRFRANYRHLAETPVVLYLARLHPIKGLDDLLPAWRRVAREMPAARLVIAGTGDRAYVESLDRQIADLGLNDHVQLIGQIVGPAKWEALVDADLFVLPSRMEGFSMSITEALAAGCPPVVTRECNFDELEPPAPEPPAGVVIPNRDMDRFADTVIDLLRDAGRRQALSTAGRELVRARYTWEKIAADMERVYRHILAGGRFSCDGAETWRTEPPRPQPQAAPTH